MTPYQEVQMMISELYVDCHVNGESIHSLWNRVIELQNKMKEALQYSDLTESASPTVMDGTVNEVD